MQRIPAVRRDGLIISEVDGEILIYDQETHQAYCLNETAALAWKLCDGTQTAGEITSALRLQLGEPLDEQFVYHAVEQFSQKNLLTELSNVVPLSTGNRISRRRLMRTFGLASMVALPLVTSMVVPTPAQAGTCLPTNSPCQTSVQCCSNLCQSGICL